MNIWHIFTNSYAYGLIVGGFIVYLVFSRLKKLQKNYPPGPKGWPILGYLSFITARPEDVLQKLGKQYGHVFMFPLGMHNVVVLNSMESVKEGLVKQGDIFSGKPPGFQLLNYSMDYLGVFAEEGESWKEQRKFIMNTLKEFGVGKLSLEDKILEECDAVKEEITKFGDGAFPVAQMLGKAITNVLSSVLFGDRHEHDDSRFEKWVNICKQVDIAVSNVTALDFFPLINKLPGWMNGMDHLHKILTDYHYYANYKINNQIKTFQCNAPPRGYIDCFLIEMYKRNRNGETNHVFDIHRLHMNILILVVAGTVSTIMTMAWAVKLLLSYPDVLQKMVQEIDSVIGKERRPSWLDHSNMPYTEAVIYEVQRVADVIPIGIPRSNTDDTKVCGYDIPKRSMIFINTPKLHNDPTVWGDPEKFRPERFIDKATKKCIKPDYFLPFGIGRRSCPGDVLARMNMFLILVSLLQNFTIALSNNSDIRAVSIKSRGIVRYLEEFYICAKK